MRGENGGRGNSGDVAPAKQEREPGGKPHRLKQPGQHKAAQHVQIFLGDLLHHLGGEVVLEARV